MTDVRLGAKLTMLEKAKSLWPDVLRNQEQLCVDAHLPLIGLGGLESEFGFEALKATPVLSNSRNLPAADAKPADLTAHSVVAIRAALKEGSNVETWRTVAERFLRYCEIRFPNTEPLHSSMKSRAFAASMLTAFMFDFALGSGDARYLNAGLKMLDWQGGMDSRLGSSLEFSPASARALYCRNVLFAAHMLRRF